MDNPPTPFWALVLYTTCSPSLNLWYVENPIVDKVAPNETLAELGSEKNSTEWEINLVTTDALASDPLPPVIDTVGTSVKSNPLLIMLIFLKLPLTARIPVAPVPTGSSIFKIGGLIISKPNPGETTSTSSSLP